MGKQRRTPIEKAIDKAKGQDRYARQTRYHARREEMGLTRIAVWVPTDRLDEFKAAAHEMVSDHIGAQSND
jgi:vacuolar-type H+-ATPase subunit I/STV1